jgi:hypothetical protein
VSEERPNKGGRPSAEVARQKAEDARQRKIADTLTEFSEAVPNLLLETAAMIREPATSPAVKAQLIWSLDKLVSFLPAAKTPEPQTDDARNAHGEQVRAALTELAHVGLIGRAHPIDETQRVKTLPELTAELAARRAVVEAERAKLERQEREIEARRARVEELNRRMDEAELRPLTIPPPAGGGGS